ncbi:MAG: beta strand repeat-containing protein, partial [Maricaulaceae bacterium]
MGDPDPAETQTFIVSSVISGNVANGSIVGGAGVAGFGASITTISSSLVSGNTAYADGGGVLADQGAELSVLNSSIVGNFTGNVGSGTYGGGVAATMGSTVNLVNATVTGNSAEGVGGAAYLNDGSVLNIANSILAGNASGEITGVPIAYTGVEIYAYGSGTTVATSAVNILGSTANGVDATVSSGGADIVIDGAAQSDLETVFASVGANGLGVTAGLLADNSGPEVGPPGGAVVLQTVALLDSAANPALDAGDATASLGVTLSEAVLGVELDGVAGLTGTLTTIGDFAFDQRGDGFARIVDGPDADTTATLDLGAFELQAAAVVTDDPSLIVTTLDDVVDDTDGVTSLREAIGFVNDGTFAAGSAITFDPTVFTGGAASLIRLSLGALEITTALTIDGTSATDVVISSDAVGNDVLESGTFITDVDGSLASDASSLDDNTRVFDITGLTSSTSIIDLTITGGRTTGDGAAADDRSYAGGGVRTDSDLTLIDTTIAGNSTTGEGAAGGGVAGVPTEISLGPFTTTATPDVTVTDSVFSGNSTAGLAASGGAIYAAGEVTLTGVTVSGNSSADYGGGVALGLAGTPFDSTLSVTDSVFTNNVALSAGAISIYDAASIVRSTITGNTAVNEGGGIRFSGLTVYDTGSLQISESVISDNTVSGVSSNGGAISIIGFRDAFVDGSILVDNTVTGTILAYGGAISALMGDVFISDSVLSGNEAGTVGADQLDASGGAIFVLQGYLQVLNTTLVGNFITNINGDGGAISLPGDTTGVIIQSTITGNATLDNGGGVNVGDGSLNVVNSIIVGNAAGGVGPDIAGGATVTVEGFNLFGSPTSGFTNGDITGDSVNVDVFGVDDSYTAADVFAGLTSLTLSSGAVSARSRICNLHCFGGGLSRVSRICSHSSADPIGGQRCFVGSHKAERCND